MLVLSIWTAIPSAVAQTRPDAGVLQQQIDRTGQLPLPERAAPERPAEPAELTAPAGATVTVSSFHFAGNTLLSEAQLAPVVGSYLGRPLTFSQLQAAVAAVAAAYRDAGWIVRAYLPQQDIVDGAVTIQVVEAVFSGAHLEGPEPTRLRLSRVLGLFAAQQKTGELLSAEKLDRALLLADDLPGVTVSGTLERGAREGETALALKLADEPLATGEVIADNSGARATGEGRLSANLYANSALQLGDRLIANLLYTDGTVYARLDGTVPVGNDGWRIGANTSYLAYRLVAPEFSGLAAHGNSEVTGVEASYPVVRARLRNLYLNLAADHKSFQNFSAGATTTSYQDNVLSVALAGNLFDRIGGGGANTGSVAVADGTLNLGGSPNADADAATTRSAGNFRKLSYQFSRQQVLTDQLALFGGLSGQWASRNLDSSEKFYLGGPGAVRAYPANEAGGSDGTLMTLELRGSLPRGFKLTGFYDYGSIHVNHENSFPGAPLVNSYSLQGAGLSTGWQAQAGASVKLTWARRMGSNANASPTGKDQDGTFYLNRFWVIGNLPL